MLAGVGLAACRAEQPPAVPAAPAAHAKVTLVRGAREAAPGATVDVGVSFAIDPGWHLYWNGRNDTGEAPKVRLDLPPGVTAGPTLWPAPERHVSGGDILDHVYQHGVTLVIPVTIPADAPQGSEIRISADCSWLVCDKVCVFEKGSAATTIKVGPPGAKAVPGEGDAAIAGARERVPRPVQGSGVEVSMTHADGSGAGGATITVPGASVLEFYPSMECAELAEPLRDTRTTGERLAVRFKASQGSEKPVLSGVLGVWKKAGGGAAYYVLNAGG